MTSNFSFPRLLQLIKRQWFENYRMYLFSMLALLGLMALAFTFWILSDGTHYKEGNTYIVFIVGLYISGCVFASMSFSALGDKSKGIYWLSFPASHLEKLITMIFYTTIFFVVVYCACFFLIQSIALAYVKGLVASDNVRYSLQPITATDGVWEVFKVAMYGFIGVQAFFLLGSVYFSRYSFVMSTIVSAALFFIFLWYCDRMSGAFLGKLYSWEGLKVKLYENNFKTYRSYHFLPIVDTLLTFVIKYIWAPVFWLATWYRLKEKQI